MSDYRTPSTDPHHPCWRAPIPEPPQLDLSDNPDIQGHEAAARWCRENITPAITPDSILKGTAGKLPGPPLRRYLIGGRRWYSTRDLWHWVQGMAGTVGDADRKSVSA